MKGMLERTACSKGVASARKMDDREKMTNWTNVQFIFSAGPQLFGDADSLIELNLIEHDFMLFFDVGKKNKTTGCQLIVLINLI